MEFLDLSAADYFGKQSRSPDLRTVGSDAVCDSSSELGAQMQTCPESKPQKPIGASAGHVRLVELIDRVAGTDVELLITGETGVGKERYARYAHSCSGRSTGNFVAINCGGLPMELFENELFGHAGGAYTGARGNSVGLVNEAENGTLFLDEVDALPLASQVKLLRFVQEKEYRRLGETCVRRSNVRFIAATNADLDAAVKTGQFREDLLFRLRVFPLDVPPLRSRREDIPILLEAFIDSYSNAYRLPRPVFSDGAMRRILGYHWPGNVRELENCVRYLTCLQLKRPVDMYDLLLRCEASSEPKVAPSHLTVVDGKFQQLKREVVRDFETGYILDALKRSDGNIARAAAASGKPRRVFFELMRKYGLKAHDVNADEQIDSDDPPRARRH